MSAVPQLEHEVELIPVSPPCHWIKDGRTACGSPRTRAQSLHTRAECERAEHIKCVVCDEMWRSERLGNA